MFHHCVYIHIHMHTYIHICVPEDKYLNELNRAKIYMYMLMYVYMIISYKL